MINLKHDITIAVSKGRILEEGLILLKKLEIEISEDIKNSRKLIYPCLLYTSDAADDTPCVDLGGRRII